ncbi:MAG: hypothetical protein V1891_01995 [bacterium]
MEKSTKKKIVIRLIVYPIIIILAIFLYRFIWVNYTGEYIENSKTWRTFKMNLRGVEFCETPEEAIQHYADALIRGDRREALGYVYKPKYDTKKWDGHKKRLYEDFSDEELKKRGEKMIKDGYLEKKSDPFPDWVVEYNFNGEIVKGPTRLIYTDHEGWEIY